MSKKNRPKNCDDDDVTVDDDVFHDPRQERRQKRRNRRKRNHKFDDALMSARYGDYEDFEELQYSDDELQYDDY